MALKTDKFAITRYWLSTAISELPGHPDLFTKAKLSAARKAFLAGANQLTAIKNWLSRAEVIEVDYGRATLTDVGKLMAAQDERAEKAWTWWLFHLHLCANGDAFPYSTFYWRFEPEGKTWWTFEGIVDELGAHQDSEEELAKESVKSYFEGVEQTFRPGHPLHSLGLVEQREPVGETGRKLTRRKLTCPADVVVAYTSLLYHSVFFSGMATVEARLLLERGMGGALGMRDADIRDSFVRISQHSRLSGFVQYTQAANLDSLQFVTSGLPALKKIRAFAYETGDIRWP